MAMIVVVDDDPQMRSVVVRYLRGLGHQVTEASNGKEAVDLMAYAADLDLVITDINMPEMDGLELITALRDRRVGVPVIAMSGGGLLDERILLGSAAHLGAVATLAKPFELEALSRSVASALAQS